MVNVNVNIICNPRTMFVPNLQRLKKLMWPGFVVLKSYLNSEILQSDCCISWIQFLPFIWQMWVVLVCGILNFTSLVTYFPSFLDIDLYLIFLLFFLSLKRMNECYILSIPDKCHRCQITQIFLTLTLLNLYHTVGMDITHILSKSHTYSPVIDWYIILT